MVSEVIEAGVLLTDGEVVKGDEVLVTLGSRPNTAWLSGSGLTVDDGVACDAYCQVEQRVVQAGHVPGRVHAFAPVPYFWSDQYGMKIQAYGYLRGHDEVPVVEGNLAERRFVAAYRTGHRLNGALAIGVPPRAVRRWRQAIAVRTA
ncbi:oxidoreductase C-terminal domain-containing protein [Streptomyces sp. NPDC058256]|uniref:oxidoreductase C-terminal domain-containing protein n=1 Tax=Streptomyces sp. NPDC058256 TaxID=3346408 RepID=UPI0036EDA067